MRGKTNLPKGIIYKEPEVDKTVLHWTPNALTISDDLVKVLQFGEKLIALGDSGNIAVSEDGLYWACRKISDYTFTDMVIVDNTCTAVGYDTKNDTAVVAHSSDLVNWNIKSDHILSEGSSKSEHRLHGIAHNGQNYIFIGTYYERSSTSSRTKCCCYTDLLKLPGTEMSYLVGTFADKVKCIWGNNRLLINFGGKILVTSDGISYEDGNLSLNTSNGDGVSFANGIFFVNRKLQSGSIGTPDPYFYHLAKASISGTSWTSMYEITEPYNGTIVKNMKMYRNALYVNNKYLLFSDNVMLKLDDLYDYSGQTDYKVVSPGIVITGVMQFKNRIICVCEGGVVVTADIEIGDRELIVLPQEADNTMYIKKTDNVRRLLVKSVTSDIDADIRPENIKAGVTILGVTGTYESGV